MSQRGRRRGNSLSQVQEAAQAGAANRPVCKVHIAFGSNDIHTGGKILIYCAIATFFMPPRNIGFKISVHLHA